MSREGSCTCRPRGVTRAARKMPFQLCEGVAPEGCSPHRTEWRGPRAGTARRFQPSCGAPPVDLAYVKVMDELQNRGRTESELAPQRHSCGGPSCVRPFVDRHHRLARRWRKRRCCCPRFQAGTRSVVRREAVAETVVRAGERRVRLLLCSSAGRAQAQADDRHGYVGTLCLARSNEER